MEMVLTMFRMVTESDDGQEPVYAEHKGCVGSCSALTAAVMKDTAAAYKVLDRSDIPVRRVLCSLYQNERVIRNTGQSDEGGAGGDQGDLPVSEPITAEGIVFQ